MTYRGAIHDHRHPHGQDDSYGDHQDRDGHRNVGNRMIYLSLAHLIRRNCSKLREKLAPSC
jgi:hypothetical protein